MATDPDYRANQRECNNAWKERNPGYWRNYRKSHPGYVERNRLLQKARRTRQNASIFATAAAKMDLPAGTRTYWLIPEEGVAKMDALPRKVVLIPVS